VASHHTWRRGADDVRVEDNVNDARFIAPRNLAFVRVDGDGQFVTTPHFEMTN